MVVGSAGVYESQAGGGWCGCWMVEVTRHRVGLMEVMRSADSRTRREQAGTVTIQGRFKNFNTIEEFKKTETKKELFDAVVDEVS